MTRFLSQEKEVPLSISSLIHVANAATINIISKTLIDLFYIIFHCSFSHSLVFLPNYHPRPESYVLGGDGPSLFISV